MTEPPKKTEHAGCLGGILAGLFGVVAGFVIGYLSICVFVPFANAEGRKWLPGIALLFGIVTAPFDGLVGIFSGFFFGAEATIRAAATKGMLGGLIGIVLGFIAGVMFSGFVDHEWAFLTDGSTNGALLGGYVGFVAGTIFGARAAARAKHERSASER